MFGSAAPMIAAQLPEIRGRYPNAYVCGGSTAGEIVGREVRDDSVLVTAIELEKTELRAKSVTIASADDSFAAGRELGTALPHAGLTHAFLLSDGLAVNGNDLLRGLGSVLPPGVSVTGGRSGDGERFGHTYVCAGDTLAERRSVLLGFYGDRLRVGYSSMGGWDPFGPERRVTRARAQRPLRAGRRERAGALQAVPGRARQGPAGQRPAVSADGARSEHLRERDAGRGRDRRGRASMIFAGDVPEGSFVRLMHGNFDCLVDGACAAGRASQQMLGVPAELAILVSCVGRKQLLKQRVEEEVEGVIDALDPRTHTTGFYAYGELSPLAPGRAPARSTTSPCRVTLLSEV